MNNENFQNILDYLAESLADKIAMRVNQPAPTPQPEGEEYLTTKEALELLKIKQPATLKDYVKKGWIPEPTQRGGRGNIYKKSDLQNFLDHGC